MNIFSFIKNTVSILDVVNEYATLKKAGLYWKGICPFHQEKTPSFTVSPHREIFYCFGCHSGGDVISFISKAEQYSALEAVNFLADRYNIEIPEELRNQSASQLADQENEKKRYHLICQRVAQWCHDALMKSPAIQRYLKGRAISLETMQAFSLGYFPGGQRSLKRLIDFVKNDAFLAQDLISAHILAEGKNVLYSSFEERIIFPIKDHLGRYVGFGGRTYKKNDNDRPKYYNCKENRYFSKGSLLFGLDQAKSHIQQHGTVFLVEGYTDCLAMVQHGFAHTVATLGTACTLEHLTTLARYAQELYVLYDGDQAGKKAMLRLTELCWQVDVELKIITLPPEDDPASYIQKGGNLNDRIAQAQDIFIFSIESSAQDFMKKNLTDKVTIIRNILSIIQRIEDPLKQEILLQRAAKAFDISLSSLKKELQYQKLSVKKGAHKKPNTWSQSTDQPSSNSINRSLKEIPILEKKLFSVIINNVHLLKPGDEEYLLQYLSPALQTLLQKIGHIKGDAPHMDFVRFFDVLNEQEKNLVSHLVLECQEYEGPENLDYLLTQFQKKNWKSFVADTRIKLSRAKQENDQHTIKQVLHRFQELKQKLLSRGLI